MSYLNEQAATESQGPPAPTFSCPPDDERLSLKPRRILEAHLARILVHLKGTDMQRDSAHARGLLLDLSAEIRSESSKFRGSDYRWVLNELTAIYAQGFGRRSRESFTTTAAAYARVIEDMSRTFPDQDYCEALGQLFGYMISLFRQEKEGWKSIYESILSVPDSVAAKKFLDRTLLLEIRDWTEAGVGNLFAIRADVYGKIADIQARIEGLDREITQAEAEAGVSPSSGTALSEGKVVQLASVRARLRLGVLRQRRQGFEEAKRNEEAIVHLIESDIREFEDKLRRIARCCFLRAV